MKYSLILVLALVLLTPGCDDDDPKPETPTEGYEVGNQAFDFELEDNDGTFRSLTDYRGKLVLLEFWDIDCSKCVNEMQDVERLWNDYRDRDFVIIGLSVNLDVQRWAEFVSQTGASGFARDWVQLKDSDLPPNVFTRFRVSSTPTRMLINEEGVIVASGLDKDAMRTTVEEALGI